MTNNRRLLVMLLIIIVCLLVVIAILKITSQKVVCNKPYILVGTSCCLDQNDNSICDKDETTLQQETTISKSTTFVSKVVDGDTIELQNKTRVRLLGINTPEKGQPYYNESTARLKELIEGKNVVLESDVQDKDQYGRLLRHVFVNDLSANLQLVKEGYANVLIIQPNTKYETSLINAQNEAKAQKLNIWKRPITSENICDNTCIGISYFQWGVKDKNDCEYLNEEYVTFINTCQYPCDLTNWTVKDKANHIYTFPSFVLDNGTTVTLYTGCGTNTKAQLYWCSSGYSCNAIWNNKGGDTLYLRNSNGELVLDYSYPGFQ